MGKRNPIRFVMVATTAVKFDKDYDRKIKDPQKKRKIKEVCVIDVRILTNNLAHSSLTWRSRSVIQDPVLEFLISSIWSPLVALKLWSSFLHSHEVPVTLTIGNGICVYWILALQ